MRWFTSDLHIGHTNIIDYCDRPFTSVGEMYAALAAEWNSVVSAQDEVWVLGDLAMGQIDLNLPLAGQLNGRKHLVIGNHDRPFGRNRTEEWDARYRLDGGFVKLHHDRTTLTLGDGTEVTLCHFPYSGDSGDRDRYVSQRPPDDGGWLLHGHVHERWRQRGRMINVGVDAWAGRLVSEPTIIDLIAAGERDLPRLDW